MGLRNYSLPRNISPVAVLPERIKNFCANFGYPTDEDQSVGTPAMAQLYCDRADAENGFDELKNQWGWGGFTTQDIERCQTSARAVALIYNWWSWYCRALLLAAVGRATKHAGKTRLYLTPMHAAKTNLMRLIVNIRAALNHVKKVAEQYPEANRWKALLDYIMARIISRRPQKLLETCALLAG